MTSGRPQAQSAAAWQSPYPLRLTAARAAAMLDAANRQLGYVPGEVVVKFKNGVGPIAQDRALSTLRARPSSGDLTWMGDVAVWADPREQDATILAAQLAAQPEVEYAEPNYLYHTTLTPNDPGYAVRQWNLQTLDFPRAWDINAGAGTSTIVAVVDTGVTSAAQNYVFPSWDGTRIRNVSVPFAQSPDFAPGRVLAGLDLAFWDGPVLDMVGHGTHVASTIGEDADNNVADAGIAYHATILPVKVCIGYWEFQFALSSGGNPGFIPPDISFCPNSVIAEGIRYAADSGAHVINLSLGGPSPSTAIRDALQYASGKGVFIAISMGNEYEEGNPTDYPAAYAATMDGVMAVAAVGKSLRRSFYSNTGSHTEIAAPGGDSRDGGAAGYVYQATINPNDSIPISVISPRFDRYAEVGYQGTSMAAPHVSGLAALIHSQGVTQPAAIEALIKKTAKDLGAAGRDDEFGAGLIQPRAALYGFGVAR